MFVFDIVVCDDIDVEGDCFLINELFVLFQGEGKFVGVLSMFVCISGCNFCCWFCDFFYILWELIYVWLSFDEIVVEVELLFFEYVVVIGGELFVYDEIDVFLLVFDDDYYLIVEMNGMFEIDVLVDFVSISFKFVLLMLMFDNVLDDVDFGVWIE